MTLEEPGLDGNSLETLQSMVDEEGTTSHDPLVAVTPRPQLRLSSPYPADPLGHMRALF